MIEEFVAVLLIEMDDNLDVAQGRETVAGGFEIRLQGPVVVDLAVEDQGDAAVFIEQRLMAVVDADDRQAAHAQGDSTVTVGAAVVGAAMDEGVVHRVEDVGDASLAKGEDACDAAHGWMLTGRLRPPRPSVAEGL